jgi:serine/threonine protein kinase
MAVPVTSEPLKRIGPYELLREVGVGSFGTVYQAQHGETKEIVAVKILAPEVARDAVYMKRFEQEFRVASRLSHPNIVRYDGYDDTGPQPYLVMEFIDGESLGEKLERVKRLPEDEALRIIVQVAHGLHFAHQAGLIHRDVKPDNVMVSKDGEVKVLDLGLAKETATTMDLTRPGTGLGTPSFMAPEQFRNAKNASIRCDIYSLAAMLYQMVTGTIPFGDCDVVQTMMRKLQNDLPPARVLVRSLSARTDAAIRRAMDVEPEIRPATCLEFVADLLGPDAQEKAAPAAEVETLREQPSEAIAATVPPEPSPPGFPEPAVSMPSSAPLDPAAPPPAGEPQVVDWPTFVFVVALFGLLLVVLHYFNLL